MLVDSNGLWPEWVSKVAKAAAIVVTAAVVVAATVATAGAAGAAIGIAAGMAVGSTAVVGTVATVATGFIYGVAGYVGATAISDTIEVFSGYNPIRDFVFRGNSTLYDTTKILAYGAAAGFTEIGSQNYGLHNVSSYHKNKTELHSPSSKTKVNLLPETRNPSAIKDADVIDEWNSFLGTNTTDINPRTGLHDANRIFSADGMRSIRFGPHEMRSYGTAKSHFHYEFWSYDSVNDIMTVKNVMQRIK